MLTTNEKDLEILQARYYNVNGFAIAVVAVITSGVDWTAYIGATPSTFTEEETTNWVTRLGAKLSEKDARYYFSDISLPYRY
jgi:hypothetical protein